MRVIIPTTDWTLGDWMNALKIRNADFAELLVEEGLKADKRSAEQYIYDVKSRKRRQRIAYVDHAYTVIKCLNRIATTKNLPYMSCENLKQHGELFLNNLNICSREFGEFSQSKLEQICRSSERAFNAFALMKYVLPRPPLDLFGRDEDLKCVEQSVAESPVTVVSGLAGIGKTALAWKSVKQLMTRDDYFTEFDWSTDKRFLVGVDGIPRETGIPPLNFEIFLKNMIARFNWTEDMEGEMGPDLLAKCASRLTQVPYLLVVDNLETIEDSAFLVDSLIDLLGRAYGKTPISRAIITSRHRVEKAGCRSIALQGINHAFRVPYLKQLIRDYDLPQIQDSFLEELANITDGNPLLMQMGLQRCVLNPQVFDKLLELPVSKDFLTVFSNFFYPILQDLKATDIRAYWLLLCAAHMSIITGDELLLYWQHQFGNDLNEIFYRSLAALREKMLLDFHNASEAFGIHPFVQTYLRSIETDDDFSHQ